MTSDRDLLRLTQWLSPAFPVGGYAYSHGLEAEIAHGRVTDPQGVADWLGTVLRYGAGRSDAVLLCRALEQDADLGEVGLYARALAGSAERLEETMAQGRAFAAAVVAVEGQDLPPDLPMPVAVGGAARGLDLAPATVARLYLHGFASNLLSGAVRFLPMGQAQGQRVLSDLHPVIDGVAAQAPDTPLSDIHMATFGAEMAAMEHETLDVRIFRT